MRNIFARVTQPRRCSSKAHGSWCDEDVTFYAPRGELISLSRFHIVKLETHSEFAVLILEAYHGKRSRTGQRRWKITRVSFLPYTKTTGKILTRPDSHVSDSVKAGEYLYVYLISRRPRRKRGLNSTNGKGLG